MRKLVQVMIVAAAVLIGGAGAAQAKGPSGSTESKDNKVTCNRNTGQSNGGANVYQAGNGVFVSSAGVEICSDDDSAADGRVIVSASGYASADGDSSNPSQAQGWARLDSAGPTCGSETDPKSDKENDSTLTKGRACA